MADFGFENRMHQINYFTSNDPTGCLEKANHYVGGLGNSLMHWRNGLMQGTGDHVHMNSWGGGAGYDIERWGCHRMTTNRNDFRNHHTKGKGIKTDASKGWSEWRPTMFYVGPYRRQTWMFEPCNALSGIDFDRAICHTNFFQGGNAGGWVWHKSAMAKTFMYLGWGNVIFHGAGGCPQYGRADTIPIDFAWTIYFHMVHPQYGNMWLGPASTKNINEWETGLEYQWSSDVDRYLFNFDTDIEPSIAAFNRMAENPHLFSCESCHDYSYTRTMQRVNNFSGRHPTQLKPFPSYSQVITIFVQRVVSVCVLECLPGISHIWSLIWDGLAGSIRGPDSGVSYNPEHGTGKLNGIGYACDKFYACAWEFGQALLWQEGMLGFGGTEAHKKCGWESHDWVGVIYPSWVRYSMHSHWHWAATDVMTNFYAMAKVIQDTYRTCNGGFARNKFNLSARKSKCCYPSGTAAC
jgi:hypothetical protein